MKKFLLLLIFSSLGAFAQEVDITDALKKIEVGKISEANSLLLQLKKINPNDPSIIFLDAVLTQDGNEAIKKYSIVFEKFPNSLYADASVFRVFSYYYSIGSYKKANEYLLRLKQNYPQSPYISIAERTVPANDEEPIKTIIDAPKEAQTTIKIERSDETKSSASNFIIQAGAFINAENAKNLCDKLNKDGYSTEITTKEIGGSQLKIVNAGGFLTEEEAKKALAIIESKYNLKGRIISITSK